MKLTSNNFEDGQRIPDHLCFGNPDPSEHMTFGRNRNPHLKWSDGPAGTRAFVVLCVDPDVPSRADDVNQEGKTLPKDMPRVDFYHWVMINVPPSVTEIEEGEYSDGVTARGKDRRPGPGGAQQGLNGYTGFMKGSELEGNYYGYDGPCPPWNDERLHHYHFQVHALDQELELHPGFTGDDVRDAMKGHVLDSAELIGTYTLYPGLTP